MARTYDITVRGSVQDVGLRDLIEHLGRANDLPGIVYNDPDGSVRIVTRGSLAAVDRFVAELREKSAARDAVLTRIDRGEVDRNPPLPEPFVKVPTDDLDDVGRKIDEGIELLRGIKDDTGAIRDDTGAIREDTGIIKDDTAAIREDTGVIKDDTAAIREDTEVIKDDTAAIRADTGVIRADMADGRDDEG